MKNKTTAGFPIREERSHRIEVHVAGFCFRRHGRSLELLVGRRTRRRELFPDLWECGGGQVHAGDNFVEALTRQFFEEFGIQVHPISLFSVYEIHRAKGVKIPGLKFMCTPTDHGDIVRNRKEFSAARWATYKGCRRLKMIPGVRAEVRPAFELARGILAPGKKPVTRRRIQGFAPASREVPT